MVRRGDKPRHLDADHLKGVTYLSILAVSDRLFNERYAVEVIHGVSVSFSALLCDTFGGAVEFFCA